MGYSCRKTIAEETAPPFVEKAFVVTDEAETKAKLMDLVNQTRKTEVHSRDFSDTEVNEGKWLLEATGNYLWQANLDQLPTTKVVELQVEVTNTVAANVIKMVGSSMTSAFNAIKSNAEQQVANSNEHLAALDVDIVSVNAQKTVLQSRVVITTTLTGNDCNSSDHQNSAFWSMNMAAAERITSCSFKHIPVYPKAEGAFYPVILVKTYNPGRQCRVSSPYTCLWGTEFDTFTAVPTEYQWFNLQGKAAVNVMDGLQDEIFGVPAPSPTPLKGSLKVSFNHTDFPLPYYNYFGVSSVTFKIGPVFEM